MDDDLVKLREALRSYQQADAEGVMVLVSREACDKAADAIERLSARIAALESGQPVEVNEMGCLPCPFCGEKNIDPSEVMFSDGDVAAGCQVCDATGPKSHTKEDSAMRWNSRAAMLTASAQEAK